MAPRDVLDASVHKALGHPLRMRLLTLISERGEASPVQMSRELGRPLATVSHHTRVLRDLGYIELARTEPRRGAVEHYYRAAASPLIDDEQWELLPIAARRRVSGQLFRQVVEDGVAAGKHGGFDVAGAHVARKVLDLDARGWRELSRAVDALLRRAEAIQERSDARANARDEQPQPSELAILHFAIDRPASGEDSRPPRRR
jgi:DNA-binding transcriptional ArsR family regulator